MKDFSEIAEPLLKLTRKDVPFECSDKQQEAFRKLKESMVTAPVLKSFDPLLQTQLITDASGVGVGAIFEQQISNGWHDVADASRMLNKHQKNIRLRKQNFFAIVS